MTNNRINRTDGFDQDLYDHIVSFLENQAGVTILKPEFRLFHDLGIDGDDGYELMTAFNKQFDVDMSNLAFHQHFGPEGFNPFVLFLWLYWFLFDRDKLKAAGVITMIPITVMDLYEGARMRKFPDLSNRAPE